MTASVPVLEVNDLKVHFRMKRKHLFEAHSYIHAVDGVSLKVEFGKTLGLVGESGSGKTTTGLAIARLVPASGGSVKIMGTEVLGLEGEALRIQRQHIQFVFQDPYSSLNPRLRAGRLVREALDRLKVGNPTERNRKVNELFGQVGLSREQERLFPISSPEDRDSVWVSHVLLLPIRICLFAMSQFPLWMWLYRRRSLIY